MLIDDHFAMGVIFKTMLTAMGYAPADFDFCLDVEAALINLEKNEPYNIIFLDHIVPPTFHFRQSLALLEKLNPETRIILFSGEIPADFGSDAVDKRISACLEKDELSAENLYSLLKSHDVPLAS